MSSEAQRVLGKCIELRDAQADNEPLRECAGLMQDLSALLVIAFNRMDSYDSAKDFRGAGQELDGGAAPDEVHVEVADDAERAVCSPEPVPADLPASPVARADNLVVDPPPDDAGEAPLASDDAEDEKKNIATPVDPTANLPSPQAASDELDLLQALGAARELELSLRKILDASRAA